MQFFIVVAIVLYAALFFMMSLPITDDSHRVEPDTQTRETIFE